MSILIKNKVDVSVSDLWDLVGGPCTCEVYDDETDTSTPAKECYGDCGQWAIDDFVEVCSPFFRAGPRDTYWPTWQGLVPCHFELQELKDILRILPPRHGDYELKYRLVKEPGRGNKRVWIAIYLRHHDGSMLYFF